jgi:chromosome segregation protein
LQSNRLANIGPLREKLGREIAHFQGQLEIQQSEIGDMNRLVADLAAKKRALNDRMVAAFEEAKDARQTASTLAAANQQAEIAKTRAEAKKASALQRLLEEYALAEPEVMQIGATVEVPEDAPGIAQRLRREIRGMGDVNVGAIQAYEQLTARHDELHGQQLDILEGIEQVESAIRELDELTRERFLTAFEKVQAAFRSVFQAVFPEGEADLLLTDAEHVLDTGIVIDVRLPGKRKQPLQLLSGGERSLCAAAFLFALLRVKPSPLVILDEVDAPLDGRNVERFTDLLRQFFGSTQFIVITHNPVTIESAPIWLGVTMNEPGVSTLVPAKLRDAKQFVSEFAAV